MPKRLLRSVIEFDKEISQDNLVRNFELLRRSVEVGQLEWRTPDDQIYKYVLSYFQQFVEMPSAQTVLNYFQGINSLEAIERLKDIQVERSYARTNFVNLLQNLQEDLAKIRTVGLLKETHEILLKGVEDPKTKETKKGVEDAILHFTKKAQDIRIIDTFVQVHGDIRKDGAKMREEYELAESNPGKITGVLTGINEIDLACKGVKKGELWIHAAFPSELKTMLANNWCYNAVTRIKKNVVYVSFEMTREQIRRSIYTIHTANARFAQQGYKPLDYKNIRDGILTREEKEFYFNLVIPDFENNPDYTHFELVTPDREWTMDDVRTQVELLHKDFEVGLVILDHGQWIEARKSRRNKDYTIELNSVINDAKRFALNFDHNKGVPILMLFQINREGKALADKNEGVYRISALTYANACITKGTLITTNKGFIPIEKIKTGMKVWNSSGWGKVLSVFDNGIKPTVKVCTDRGLSIQVTRDHKFKTLSPDGLHWIQASNLQNKYILMPVGMKIVNNSIKLPCLKVHKWERFVREGEKINVPEIVTPDLAYLLGAYAGDGTLDPYNIGYCGNRTETKIRDHLKHLFKKVFNQTLILRNSKEQQVFYLVMGSKSLLRWFKDLESDRRPGVPPCILQASSECMKAFLRGFWDTDGHINTQGNLVIGQKAAKRKTLEHVQIMLASFGIDSSMHSKVEKLRVHGKIKKYPQVILYVRSRRGRKLFYELIGFTEPKKQARLKYFVDKFSLSDRRATCEDWPVGEVYKRLLTKYLWDSHKGEEQLHALNLFVETKRLELSKIADALYNSRTASNTRKAYSAVMGLVRKKLVIRTSRGFYESLSSNYRFRFPRKCRVALSKLKPDFQLVSRGAIESLVNTLTANKVQDEDLLLLQNLLLTMIPHKVISVIPAGKENVFDLNIAKIPEYTAGGLLVHNCEKTADVITTTYLNDELRAAGMTKVTNLKNRDNALFPPFEAHVNFACRRILSTKQIEPKGFSVEENEAYLDSMDIAL